MIKDKVIETLCVDKNLARVVENVLHENIDLSNIPCCKVVTSKGKVSNNYVFGGIEGQKKLLESEGIEVSKDYLVNLEKYLVIVYK